MFLGKGIENYMDWKKWLDSRHFYIYLICNSSHNLGPQFFCFIDIMAESKINYNTQLKHWGIPQIKNSYMCNVQCLLHMTDQHLNEVITNEYSRAKKEIEITTKLLELNNVLFNLFTY